MKKHLFRQSASCDIIFKKVSGRRIQPPKRGKSADLYVLYIIYISNGNNDAMTQSNRDGGFLRVIIRVIAFSIPRMTRFSTTLPRHYPSACVITLLHPFLSKNPLTGVHS
jgi:hypothetical protein